jgi:hypothetical protein
MARPKPRKVTLRTPPDLSALSDDDLIAIEIGAPGVVTTADAPGPWKATPRHCVEARRIMTARGAHG